MIVKSMETAATILEPNKGKNLEIQAGGATYLRLPVKTRLIVEGDDIYALVKEYAQPHLQPGDILFISEKIVSLVQGRLVRIADVKTGFLARLLAGKVRNNVGTPLFRGFGHGTAPAMQLLIDEAGYLRVLFAAAVSAVTRPLGIKGAFYYLIGKRAKSVDCPMSFVLEPYTQYAKLAPLDPDGVARKLREQTGNETVIVDANYLGVFSLGKSNRRITEKFIYEVLRDNPKGQNEEQTPFLIARKK